MLPRWLQVTEEEIEEGEMLQRKEPSIKRDVTMAKIGILIGIIGLLLLWSLAWGSGCNSDQAFVVKSDIIYLELIRCGEGPVPAEWEVTVDRKERFRVPVERYPETEKFLMRLGEYYRLHPGENLIEYRAIRNGFIAGPTESIRLALVDGTNAVFPPLGGFTVSEIQEVKYSFEWGGKK